MYQCLHLRATCAYPFVITIQSIKIDLTPFSIMSIGPQSPNAKHQINYAASETPATRIRNYSQFRRPKMPLPSSQQPRPLQPIQIPSSLHHSPNSRLAQSPPFVSSLFLPSRLRLRTARRRHAAEDLPAVVRSEIHEPATIDIRRVARRVVR